MRTYRTKIGHRIFEENDELLTYFNYDLMIKIFDIQTENFKDLVKFGEWKPFSYEDINGKGKSST